MFWLAKYMKLRAFSLALLGMLAMSGAFASTVLEPPDTSSPHATMRSFRQAADGLRSATLEYQKSRSLAELRKLRVAAERISRLFDLEGLPPATRDDTGRESISLLLDILNRIPLVDLNDVPGAKGEDASKLPVRWTIPATEMRITRTETGPFAGEYQFSADTMRRLPEFHARIIHEPPLRTVLNANWSKTASEITGPLIPMALVSNMPAFMMIPLLGAPLWKFVAAGLLLAIFLQIGLRAGAYIVRRTEDMSPVARLLGQLSLPLLFGALMALWHLIAATQIHFFGYSSQFEEFFSLVVIYACAAWAGWVMIYLIVEIIIASPRIPDDSYDAHLLRLVARVISPIAFAAILAYGASDLGIPALGIVAGLGVGGIAVALAAQSTIDNLFGGLSIFADRPFRIGDLIRYGGESGVVRSIGLRSTRILSDDGNVAVVPNGQLARISITNITATEQTGLIFIVKIKSNSTHEQITRCMEALHACARADASVSARRPSVRLAAYDADTIEIDVGVEIATSKPEEVEIVRNRLMLAFASALRENGVAIASIRVAR